MQALLLTLWFKYYVTNEFNKFSLLNFENRYSQESRPSNQNTPTRFTECSSSRLLKAETCKLEYNWVSCLLFFSFLGSVGLMWRHKLRKKMWENENNHWEHFFCFQIIPPSLERSANPLSRNFSQRKEQFLNCQNVGVALLVHKPWCHFCCGQHFHFIHRSWSLR